MHKFTWRCKHQQRNGKFSETTAHCERGGCKVSRFPMYIQKTSKNKERKKVEIHRNTMIFSREGCLGNCRATKAPSTGDIKGRRTMRKHRNKCHKIKLKRTYLTTCAIDSNADRTPRVQSELTSNASSAPCTKTTQRDALSSFI